MPIDLKTDPALLARLTELAGRQMTKDEVKAQRISFVMGMISHESTLTRRQVEELIDKAEGVAA